jgi:DNA-binding transcriptional regulator/RsmH inhibitor MraZ
MVIVWSKEAIGARVDQFARDYKGDAFVEAVATFGREQLDERERMLLHDVLMERAKLRQRITVAARERRDGAWSKRMFEGRFGRRPPKTTR